MMCYENSCRMCLKGLEGPGINCIDIVELQDSLRDLFGIEIARTDTTTNICAKCFDHVMSFKALKKTVQECQKLIKDYELIRKKIVENRVSIKQEVIDLSSVKIEPGTSTQFNRRTESFTRSVTDSQINDVLNTIHDKRPQSVSLPNAHKRLRLQNGPIKCEPRPMTMTEIFVIPDDDDEENPPQSINQPTTRITENENQLISSTSKETRALNGTLASSSPNSRASTSSVHGALNNIETQKPQKVEKIESISSTAKSIMEDTIQTMNKTSSSLAQQFFGKEKIVTSTPNNAKTQSTNRNTASNKQNALNSNAKAPNVQNSTPAVPIANGEKRKRSSRARDLALKKKALAESAEMNGEVTDSEDCASVSGRSTRSGRVAKSQALRRLSHKNQIVKEANDALKQGEAATKTPEKPTNEKIENKPLNKNKRIITITLFKTNESINIRYCDQFKNTIDFNTVTDDEIEEIRGSLLMPEVWNNLKNVFKKSPPDGKTMTQLEKIFGANFKFNVL